MAKKTEPKGRRVKCFATGEYGNSLEYVKHDNRWWKNEEVYQTYTNNTLYRKKAYDLYSTIIGYEKGQIFPNYVHKRFKKLEFYGWEVIYQNMIECRESMEWAIFHKEFRNDIAQTAYLFTIMEAHINDVYANLKKQKADIEQAEKRTLEMAMYEGDDINLDVIQTAPQKKRDISQWLEEGA